MNKKMWFLITFFCVCFVGASGGRRPRKDSRIVGGTATDIRQFPYQLSLEHRYYRQYVHICGASVISKTWAVTAAHCVYKMQNDSFRIRAATTFIETGGTIYNIEAIIQHPKYSHTDDDYDIAVIKVMAPGFKYSEVLKPIALTKSTPRAGRSVVVSGWGATETDGDVVSQLRQVTVNIIDNIQCNTAYRNYGGITPRMLCAGYHKGKKRDSCGGDSGGPLTIQRQLLVGIVSVGLACGDRNHPGIYANVANLRQWITNVTGIS